MRTFITGFDSFDPKLFEAFTTRDKSPNLRRLADSGGYSPFRVCFPPQTEASWSGPLDTQFIPLYDPGYRAFVETGLGKWDGQ